MEKEYISIKDFAVAAGVSQQAIYKQLNNKLKNYVREVEGKKKIDKSALDLFKKHDSAKETNSTRVEQQLIEMLKTELNEKSEQLKAKDKQISELLQALDQAQKLNAIDKQKIMELEDKNSTKVDEKQKKSWWKSLFK